jgi:DNA-binding NarL/FixJ family response regulator
MRNELSTRECEVVRLAALGMCDKEIAAELGVGLPTVRTYWERVRIKTGTRSRTHACCAVLLAQTPGLQPLPRSV